jgi:hypothetical protein
MKRYNARYVLLTQSELDFWRPDWREPDGLPDFLTPVHAWKTGTLYERTIFP